QGEGRDAVVSAVGDVEELPRWMDPNLGTGVGAREVLWEGADRLQRTERAAPGVEGVGGHAAALLVGDVGDGLRGVEDEVPRAGPLRRRQLRQLIGCQPAGLRVEGELQ